MDKSEQASILSRGAIVAGRALGNWRRRRIEKIKNDYVDAWRAAWAEGCSAGWAGEQVSTQPYRRNPQREAWAAGWNWAHTHQDVRDPVRTRVTVERGSKRNNEALAFAKGGALGVAVFAFVRWFTRPNATRSPDNGESQ